MANVLVMRNELEAYYKVGSVYSLIGEGFTDWSEAKNPKEYSRQYVHESAERTDVIGYSPSISYAADVYSEDAVISDIVDLTNSEALGTNTHRDVVTVHKWKPTGTANEYEAYLRKYAVIPDAKGDGVEALVYTGTLKVVGSASKGVFNTSTLVFTPDTEPEVDTLGELDVTSVAGDGALNSTVLTVAEALTEGNHFVYKLGSSYATVSYNQALNTGWTAFASGDTIAAGTATKGTVCEVTASNNAVKRGVVTLVKHT